MDDYAFSIWFVWCLTEGWISGWIRAVSIILHCSRDKGDLWRGNDRIEEREGGGWDNENGIGDGDESNGESNWSNRANGAGVCNLLLLLLN